MDEQAEVRQALLPTWIGLAVYEGPPLPRGVGCTWSVAERVVAYSNGTRAPDHPPTWARHGGAFTAPASLIAPAAEAAAAMDSTNVSKLWAGSWGSVVGELARSPTPFPLFRRRGNGGAP